MSDGEISAAVWLYGAGERQAEYKRTLIMRRLYQSQKKNAEWNWAKRGEWHSECEKEEEEEEREKHNSSRH